MNGLFINSHEITWLQREHIYHSHRQGSILADLAALLEQHYNPAEHAGLRVDLVLSYSLYHFLSLELPSLSHRKIHQLLKFELENLLLLPPEELSYPFQTRVNKAADNIQVSVFAWDTQFIRSIRDLLEPYHIEVHRIFSLENLLLSQLNHHSKKFIYIHVTPRLTHLLFSQNGLLQAVTQVQSPADLSLPTCSSWIKEINSVIGAAQVLAGQWDLLCNPEADELLVLSDRGTASLKPEPQIEALVDIPLNPLLEPTFLKQKQIILLEAPQAALLAEFKKHKPQLKSTSFLAASFLILWIFWVSIGLFQGYQNSHKLQQELKAITARYAPGLSTATGLSVLEEKVATLRQQQNGQRSLHPYLYSTGIAKISKIAQTAPSLTLSRLSAKETDWTLVGKTTSNHDFELTKTELKKIFPPSEFTMTVNQKAQGEGQVSFTISMLLKGK